MTTDATADAEVMAEIKKKSATIRRFWELILSYKTKDQSLGAKMVQLLCDMLVGLVPHIGDDLEFNPQTMPEYLRGLRVLKLDLFSTPWPIGCRARELYLVQDGTWVEHHLENDGWTPVNLAIGVSCWASFLQIEGGLRIALDRRWHNASLNKESRSAYERQYGLLFQLYQARMILQTLPSSPAQIH